jgi:hypothetical protein
VTHHRKLYDQGFFVTTKMMAAACFGGFSFTAATAFPRAWPFEMMKRAIDIVGTDDIIRKDSSEALGRLGHRLFAYVLKRTATTCAENSQVSGLMEITAVT